MAFASALVPCQHRVVRREPFDGAKAFGYGRGQAALTIFIDPPPGPHAWLRTRVFIGRGVRRPDYVLIDFHIVA